MFHDPIGVVHQILMTLIVWSSFVIVNQESDKLSPKQLWRQLRSDIHQATLGFGYRLVFNGAMSLIIQ